VKLALAVGMDEPQMGGVVRAPLVLGPHMVEVKHRAVVESLVTAGAMGVSRPPIATPAS
jgi:hypothetical protein